MLLLPTEDLENGCLTALVGQIFSEMILGNGIGGKASEPWLLWEVITKVAEVVQGHISKTKAEANATGEPTEMVQGLDGHKEVGVLWSARKWFWLVLQYSLMAFTAIRFFIIMLTTSSSLPSRLPAGKVSATRRFNEEDSGTGSATSSAISATMAHHYKQPIISMKLWSCISKLLDLDMRMPWLSATFSLLQWGALCGPWKVGDTDGIIDKYVTPPSFHLSRSCMTGARNGFSYHTACASSHLTCARPVAVAGSTPGAVWYSREAEPAIRGVRSRTGEVPINEVMLYGGIRPCVSRRARGRMAVPYHCDARDLYRLRFEGIHAQRSFDVSVQRAGSDATIMQVKKSRP